MRPKILEIEGLQSFIENQVIDFCEINQNGLFGIFGNTGSGKSTILDAITLALYGKIKRAGSGTQGIININCKVARVKFTFEILKDGRRVTYRVEREYKRKKDSDAGCDSKVVRLIQIDGENIIPLADKQTEVNQKIEDILGLTHKDFTKAVVLPQNNFQEFLLLGNAERRKMLERVFYLEEYGEGLLNKLKSKMAKLDNKEMELAGELKRYEDSSNEALKANKQILHETELLKKESDRKLEQIEKEYLEKQEVFNLLEELKALDYKQSQIQQNDKYIGQQQIRIELAHRANTIIDKIHNAKIINRNIKLAKQEMEKCDNDLKNVQSLTKVLNEEYIKLKESLNNREILQQNIALEVEVQALEKELVAISKKWQQYHVEIQEKRGLYDKLAKQENELTKEHDALKQTEIGSMCLFLIENLQDGDICPVCGNVYHTKSQEGLKNVKIDIEKLETISNNITNIKLQKERILGQIQTNEKALSENEEIKKQKEDFLKQKGDIYKSLLIRYKITNIQQELDIMAKKDKEIQSLEVKIKNQEIEVQKISSNKTAAQTKYETFLKQLEQEQKAIEDDMKQKGFTEGTGQVVKSVLSEQEIKNIQQEIDEHTTKKHQLIGKKNGIQEKLKGRSITKKEWEEIESSYKLIKEENKRIGNNYAIANEMYQKSKEKNVIWNDISKKHKETEIAYKNHDELRKLLIGDKGKDNSFVDYIAEERLRYVAKKASELLGVMTQYNFELRLDTEAGFRIVDNKNGGISRSVNTLSGGETFLTSLALALALSEQIQLKGQSPLEFFFLDEGFGSLDNELLDQVIDALERISKKERVIGVISHIPELRQRISQRVIVKAATDDGVGSVIAIEKG